MNARVALDMLNSNRIEELKALLQDEIYEEALKTKPGAKKRYAAMKKYFSYHESARECLQKPCPVQFEGKGYTSFCNSWSLVLTIEDTGEIELFNEENGKYPDVGRLIQFNGIKKKIDFGHVIAEAKSKGYRLNKKEVESTFKYLMLYDEAYYKIGLIDSSLGIIDDGEPAMVYHRQGERGPITIQTSLGFCVVMPVKYEGDLLDAGRVVVIEVE